ncbi:MAG: endonuclease/exonuclease/phosphatase family protein, partial [Pseudomonadota bacterium]|nr:endonuclease/exonuclease/phosphatase family protein [Pseudomonadota bacterium]
MRIVSLNAWGGRLSEEMSAWLADVQPDVLCLQEVVFAPGSPSAWLDYRDGDTVLPQRADVMRDVSRALPDHGVTFCPAACGNLFLG